LDLWECALSGLTKQFKYFKLPIASMYFYGNFIRENNDANGKNNRDRTACHSHPFPILPFFPAFSHQAEAKSFS